MSPLNIYALQQDSHKYIVRRDQYCDVLLRIQDINMVVILIAGNGNVEHDFRICISKSLELVLLQHFENRNTFLNNRSLLKVISTVLSKVETVHCTHEYPWSLAPWRNAVFTWTSQNETSLGMFIINTNKIISQVLQKICPSIHGKA